jgi:hypothetical protein
MRSADQGTQSRMALAYSPDRPMNHRSPDFSGFSSRRNGVARCIIEADHEPEQATHAALGTLSNLPPR